MKKKKRRVRVFRIFLLLILVFAIIGVTAFGIYGLLHKDIKSDFSIDSLSINEIDYSDVKKLDLDLYSNGYLLIRLNDFKVLYGDKYDDMFYPASLTKILTMDGVLHSCSDFENETSSFSYEQREALIEADASLAYLDANEEYSIKDLLYALVLPSGADAAEALNNYIVNKTGLSLVEEMNEICKEINLTSSHFTNTTGLHDDMLYTSLSDYAKIVIDVLNNSVGKEVLKTMEHELEDGTKVKSSLISLSKRSDIKTYGGKTGYTLEAGMNICVLYEAGNRSYLLVLKNAEGSPYVKQKHIEDVNKIYDYLYN